MARVDGPALELAGEWMQEPDPEKVLQHFKRALVENVQLREELEFRKRLESGEFRRQRQAVRERRAAGPPPRDVPRILDDPRDPEVIERQLRDHAIRLHDAAWKVWESLGRPEVERMPDAVKGLIAENRRLNNALDALRGTRAAHTLGTGEDYAVRHSGGR
ncbi:MAG: hypothetical protein ACK47B_21725 [Armatimonadota bacterium]